MKIITPDDLTDVYIKFRQRGLQFLLSKFTLNEQTRTKSAFDDTGLTAANWWVIPKIRRRWNARITGNPDTPYEPYVVEKYFRQGANLRMLSLGSGVCSHELAFAAYPQFQEVVCVDIAGNLLADAEKQARSRGLHNMQFLVQDVYQYAFPETHFDAVLFHSSLHHFKGIAHLLGVQINRTLKPDGKIILNEYVGPNRNQFGKAQLKAINEAVASIPAPWRGRFRTGLSKGHVYGPGLLRMVLADPSECVESEEIKKALAIYFDVLEEKPYGGNILMYALKDIAHHFIESTPEKDAVLERLFQLEDAYVQQHPDDFLFGVYQKKRQIPPQGERG